MYVRALQLMLSVAVMLTAWPAYPATRLVFPRVLFQQGRWVGFAIANPTPSSATITLKAYNLDGTPLGGSGVTNPATVTVASGSQEVKIAWQPFLPATSPLLGSANPTRVWVEVTSETDGLTAFFLEGSDALTFVDGADLTGTGTDLLIPAIDSSGTAVSEIAIVNPNSSAAQLAIDLLRADGTAATENLPVLLESLHGVQGPIATTLGVSLTGVVAARIRSDIPVAAVSSIYRQSDDSLVTLASQDAGSPGKTLYSPQLAQGEGWSTSVGIVNTDATDKVLVNITAYRDDGTLFGPPTVKNNPVSQQLDAGGVFRADLASLFGFTVAPGTIETGWLKIEASQPSLIGYVEYSAGGKDRAIVPAQSTPVSSAIFSYQYLAGEWFTGMAILNPSSMAASVEIVSFDKSGVPFGKAQRVLKPGQKEAKVISEWIAAAGGKTDGGVYVKSDRPIIVTQLFGALTAVATAVANVPPQPVPATFDPGAGFSKVDVFPPLAVVETAKALKFTDKGGAQNLNWLVNGVPGGSSEFGTVSNAGLFSAPAKTPTNHTVTVQAIKQKSNPEDPDLSGASTVDVVQRETIVGGLTDVTSVVYLESAQRFFIAEQQVLSSAPDGARAATTNRARISLVPAGAAPTLFRQIDNETVSKMIPFVDGSTTYLLIAGYESGKIYKLRADTEVGGIPATVATGLNQPTSLAIDPISGDLFVAEAGANQITTIPRSQIVAAVEPGIAEAVSADRHTAAIPAVAPQGVAVDACSGAIYYTLADGTLHEFVGGAGTDRTIATNLNKPKHILVLYRVGFGCGQALALAVVEDNRITLVYPRLGLQTSLITDTLNSVDLTFFPDGNRFTPFGEQAIAFAESPAGSGAASVTGIRIGGMFGFIPPWIARGTTNTGGIVGPYEDPVGDTFSTQASTGLTLQDIVSVSGHKIPGSFVIEVRMAKPVSPLQAGLPNSLQMRVLINQALPRCGPLPTGIDLTFYNPLRVTADLCFDALIDVATAAWRNLLLPIGDAPVKVSYSYNIISIIIPDNTISIDKSRIVVIAGNAKEANDIAPNGGMIKLVP